jgi:hypothetical protein
VGAEVHQQAKPEAGDVEVIIRVIRIIRGLFGCNHVAGFKSPSQ